MSFVEEFGTVFGRLLALIAAGVVAVLAIVLLVRWLT